MEYRLKPIGKQLVRVCHRSLSHNHCRVRVAALKAVCRYRFVMIAVLSVFLSGTPNGRICDISDIVAL